MAEKITISAPFSQETRSLGRIGRVGENLSRQIVFDCSSALTDRPNANIICVIQRTGDKDPYAAQMTRVGDTGSYKLVLTSTEVAKSGSVRFELRMVDGDEILKAAIYTGTVEASMSGIADTPGEPIPDALNRLESAITEVGKYADLKEKVDALESSSGAVEVDTTLSVSGKAADAKATGDKVQEVAQSVTTLNTSVTNMGTRVTALESAGGGSSADTFDYIFTTSVQWSTVQNSSAKNVLFRATLEVPNGTSAPKNQWHGYGKPSFAVYGAYTSPSDNPTTKARGVLSTTIYSPVTMYIDVAFPLGTSLSTSDLDTIITVFEHHYK